MRYQKVLVYLTVSLLILVSSPRAESTGAGDDQPDKDVEPGKLDLCRADPEKNATGTPYDAVNARTCAA